MAFLGLSVPPDIVKLLASIPVPGDKEDTSSFHITITYLGEKTALPDVLTAAAWMHEASLEVTPFQCAVHGTSHFEPSGASEGRVPVICPVHAPELLKLKKKLDRHFDGAGLEYSKKFEYQPHITLAYADSVPKEIDFPEIVWTATEMILWDGDKWQDEIVIRVPFGLGNLAGKVAARSLRTHQI